MHEQRRDFLRLFTSQERLVSKIQQISWGSSGVRGSKVGLSACSRIMPLSMRGSPIFEVRNLDSQSMSPQCPEICPTSKALIASIKVNPSDMMTLPGIISKVMMGYNLQLLYHLSRTEMNSREAPSSKSSVTSSKLSPPGKST